LIHPFICLSPTPLKF